MDVNYLNLFINVVTLIAIACQMYVVNRNRRKRRASDQPRKN